MPNPFSDVFSASAPSPLRSSAVTKGAEDRKPNSRCPSPLEDGSKKMALTDLLISIGSAGLVLFTLPTVLNRNSQVPRKAASIPTASILTYFVPLFAISGLVLTSLTIAGQAMVWWLIVAFRPVKCRRGDVDSQTVSTNSKKPS